MTVETAATPELNWRVNLAFIWVGSFVGLLGANFVLPFVPFYLQELGVKSDDALAYLTGLTAAVTGLSMAFSAPLWGALGDRVGRKAMFLRALVGAGVLIVLMGAAQAVWQLVALRFAMGMFAGTMGAAAALVAATTPRERVGYALGALQTALFLANMLGPLIGGIVASQLGLRESFVFVAVLYLAAICLVLAFVKEPPAAARRAAGGGSSILQNLRVVVAERQLLFMMGMLFALWLGTTFIRPVLPLEIAELAGADGQAGLGFSGWHLSLKEEAATGVLFGVLGGASTVAALTVGPLGQRFGYRRCVAGAAMLTGLLYLPAGSADSFTRFVVLFACIGLFQGAMVPGTNALIAASAPEGKQGSAFGLAASMQSLALLAGPLAGGTVAATLGLDAVFVTIGAILVLAGAAGAMLIREPAPFVRARTTAPAEEQAGA